jgi:hypothetical protein
VLGEDRLLAVDHLDPVWVSISDAHPTSSYLVRGDRNAGSFRARRDAIDKNVTPAESTYFRRAAFRHSHRTSRYSFVHALVGRSHDVPRIPTPGTNM